MYARCGGGGCHREPLPAAFTLVTVRTVCVTFWHFGHQKVAPLSARKRTRPLAQSGLPENTHTHTIRFRKHAVKGRRAELSFAPGGHTRAHTRTHRARESFSPVGHVCTRCCRTLRDDAFSPGRVARLVEI